jgi:hypothetical protein
MHSAIFTLEVDGRPILAFEARNLRESAQLGREVWLREDIVRLKSNGTPLWDGKAPLRSRYATEVEKSIYLEAAGDAASDEMILAYLVELDGSRS